MQVFRPGRQACVAVGLGERSSEQLIPLALASGSLWFERLRKRVDAGIPARPSGLRSFWAGRLWFETVNTIGIG